MPYCKTGWKRVARIILNWVKLDYSLFPFPFFLALTECSKYILEEPKEDNPLSLVILFFTCSVLYIWEYQ